MCRLPDVTAHARTGHVEALKRNGRVGVRAMSLSFSTEAWAG